LLPGNTSTIEVIFRDIGGIYCMLYLEFIWVNKEKNLKIVFFMDNKFKKKSQREEYNSA
jgi:hypothetical protein